MIFTKTFTILFLFAAFTGNFGEILAQVKKPAVKLPCERGEKLLKNEKNEVIIRSHEELKKLVIKQITPEFPRSCRCQGIIRVSILIDRQGKVKCVSSNSGNPLLRAAAMQAAKQWTFKPTLSSEKAVSLRGVLIFEFSSDGQVFY